MEEKNISAKAIGKETEERKLTEEELAMVAGGSVREATAEDVIETSVR